MWFFSVSLAPDRFQRFYRRIKLFIYFLISIWKLLFFFVEVSNKYQYILKRENVIVNWTEVLVLLNRHAKSSVCHRTWSHESCIQHTNNSTKFLTQSRNDQKTYPIFDCDACIIGLIAIVLPTVIIMGSHTHKLPLQVCNFRSQVLLK